MTSNVLLMTFIYILLIILLLVLIIMAIKCIKVIDNINKSINDINEKLHSFDGIFYCIDRISKFFSSMNNKLVLNVKSIIRKIPFLKKGGEFDE